MAWRRIRSGSGHRYVDDSGEAVQGVTTIIGNGIPKPNLIDAAAKETAAYTLDHWDELAADRVADRLRKMERGRFERWNRGGARGTKVHELAAQLAAGHELEVPDELLGYVDAYMQFVVDWRVVELAVEAMVISTRYRYAGTLDLLAVVDGATWLIDWKTSASGVWPETALQLAAYAHAEAFDRGDGTLEPMPIIDRAAAVWLRSDGYEVVPVDISESTFRTFRYAQQIAAFRDLPKDATVGAPLQPPALEVAQ